MGNMLFMVVGGIAVNAVTYFAYWFDKRRARKGGWRVPEASLLVLGLVGGTPAAFIAQRRLRHKNRKASFQVKYWITVALQIYALTFEREKLVGFLT